MPRSLLVACALALASPALGDDCVDSPTFSFDNACEDDADWVKAGKPDNADCAWIADGNSDQCARAEDSSGRTAEEACGCACARPNRGCAWVGEGDTEARCDLVSHITAASACPATCSGSASADSETWFYKKADRDCAWVAAEKTESRCRKVGEEAAADACPGTCLDDCAGVAESAVTDAPTAELLQRCHNAPAWRFDDATAALRVACGSRSSARRRAREAALVAAAARGAAAEAVSAAALRAAGAHLTFLEPLAEPRPARGVLLLATGPAAAPLAAASSETARLARELCAADVAAVIVVGDVAEARALGAPPCARVAVAHIGGAAGAGRRDLRSYRRFKIAAFAAAACGADAFDSTLYLDNDVSLARPEDLWEPLAPMAAAAAAVGAAIAPLSCVPVGHELPGIPAAYCERNSGVLYLNCGDHGATVRALAATWRDRFDAAAATSDGHDQAAFRSALWEVHDVAFLLDERFNCRKAFQIATKDGRDCVLKHRKASLRSPNVRVQAARAGQGGGGDP